MALRLKSLYLKDEKQSVLLDDIKDITHRSFLERLWESLIRLMSPLL
jgi:cardiolipin synthase